MAAQTAWRCRIFGKETLRYFLLKPRHGHRLHQIQIACRNHLRDHTKNNSVQFLQTRGFSSCLSLNTTTSDDHLSQLSERGLAFSNHRPNDDDYIGQPIHTTHPHRVSNGEITPGITKKEYIDRRHNLMSILSQTHYGSTHKKHVIIIPSNPDKFMTTDIPYPFRQNTNFLYLTGFQEPDAVLVLETQEGLPYHKSVLFVRPRDSRRELWEGARAGTKGAIDVFGVDEAYSIKNLSAKLIERYGNKDYCIWYDHLNPAHPRLHAELNQVLFSTPKFTFKNLLVLGHNLHMLRLIKSPAEITLMRNSSSVASESLKKVMSITHPGLEESHLHITMEYECRMKGAERLSYPPVVAGGSLANTLHYINNTQLLRDGDLVLMDAGCEYHGYASDITRVWPVNGTFNEPQRVLYGIVLGIQKKCLSLCRKDVTLDYIHHAMLTLLGEELTKIGILAQNLTDAERKRAASDYCPHHVGHYIGMDTHDTHLVSRGLGLQPGMVVTIEPGLYIPSNAKNVPQRFHGIGIRIEDDVLITENGPEILSDKCPKEPEEIEKLMQR